MKLIARGCLGHRAFYCRRDALDLLEPPNVGYHSVDKGEDHMDYDLTFRPDAGRFEEALVNFPGIWGLDAAVQLHLAVGSKKTEQHIGNLIRLAAGVVISVPVTLGLLNPTVQSLEDCITQ